MLSRAIIRLIALSLCFISLYAEDLNISSEQGNFSIQLPDGFKHPEFTMTPVATEVGDITTVNYISYSPQGACMVGSSEYPQKLVSLISKRQGEVLKSAQDGALRNMQAKLLKQEEFTMESYQGRTLWFMSTAEGQPLYGQLRLVCAMPRLYHILYLTDQKTYLNSEKVSAYFNSFKILN